MLLKIFPYSIWEEGSKKSFWDYCRGDGIFSTLFVLFVIWLLISIFSWVFIRSLNKIEYKFKNKTINSITEDKESGLNFFMTFLLPLVIDDVTKWKGFFVFMASFLGVVFLLAKTTLFYKNPVLSLLGYRFFNIQIQNTEVIGICPKYNKSGKIKINYTEISKNIIFFENK
jgi:hypothetical protein